MSQVDAPSRGRWFATVCAAAVVAALLAIAFSESGASGASSVARYKVIGVAGKLEAHVTAGYGAFQCTGKTPSLFTGDIHGRRPGRPVGQQTQYGTVYNNLFKASVQRSGGSYNPGTGKGKLTARVMMPFVSGGTGEKVGCHPYTICEDHNDTSPMEMSIKLQRIGRRGYRVTWDPGGEKASPRGDDIPPLNSAGLAPIYNCLDTYFPFVLEKQRGKPQPCANKPANPGTLAKETFVLRLKCAFNRPEFHPYTDGDGTRNVTDRASIEANVKVKRVN